MNLDFWKKFIYLLFPRNGLFNGLFNNALASFNTALAQVAKDVHDWVSYIFFDVLPDRTSKLAEWSTQFNFGQTQTAAKIASEMKQQGGQSPNYLQNAIQDSEFPTLFVHEFFYRETEETETEYGDGTECGDGSECGGTTAVSGLVVRNPYPYINDQLPNNLLVNPVRYVTGDYPFECGDGGEYADGTTLGDRECADSTGVLYFDKIYPHEIDYTNEAPYYFFIGAENFPQYADVVETRQRELERIIYKIKPMHTRVVMLVNYTAATGNVYKDLIGDADVYKDLIGSADVYKDIIGGEAP